MATKPAKIPKNLDEVFKSKDLTDKFEKFCKSEYTLDNFTFIALKSWSPQNVYKLYFAKGAKYELNLAADIIKDTRALGEAKAWDDRRWKGLVESAKKEIERLMARDTFERFKKTLGPNM